MGQDFAAIAARFGGQVVKSEDDGWSPIMKSLSLKDQAVEKMRLNAEGRKRLSDLDTDISAALPTITGLRKFGHINRRERTGDIWDNAAPNWPLLRGDDSNTMISIQSDLGPNQRVVGSGSSSDRDVNLFMAGLPRIEQTRKTNEAIAERYEEQYKYATDKRAAMQSHLDKFGHLGQFDDAWADARKPPDTSGQSDLAAQAQAELARRKGKK